GRSTQGIEHRRAAFSDGQIGAAVKRHLELLLSSLTTMAPWPRSTSKLSSMIWLSRETIAQVPVDTSGHVDSLLGYQVSADVLSLMLIPFWSPSEGFFVTSRSRRRGCTARSSRTARRRPRGALTAMGEPLSRLQPPRDPPEGWDTT